MFKRAFFLIEIHTLSGREQVPVYLMSIKLRPVHAGELGYATNGYTAAATHPGAINHYWIQADNSLHPERLGGQGTELHHDGRANGNDPVDLPVGTVVSTTATVLIG